MKRGLLAVVLLVGAVAAAFYAMRQPPAPGEEERNRKFAQEMAGVVLEGQSTRLDKAGVFGPERYFIDGVNHLSGDTWLFRSRMRIGEKEVPLPVPVTVKWAGDTPVITLTDLAIPGLGTYTARVVLYRDQYAGTWSGEKGGGQMFGKIVRGK